jgi:hypothetical protein
MKKRFPSLNIKDTAAWLVAGATLGCLASAGLVIGWFQKSRLRGPVHAKSDLTPGT